MAANDGTGSDCILAAGKISSHHNNLAAQIRKHLELKCPEGGRKNFIDQYEAEGQWQNAVNSVRFAALGDQRVWANRERGGRVPVIPLQPDVLECQLWACWCEEWRPIGEKRFRLISASWTFFRGSFRYQQKQQFLRCDWDNTKDSDSEELRDQRAQPHWHFEFEDVRLTAYTPSALEGSQKLTEITEVRLAKRHFGMAGWRNGDSYPECWQAALDDRQLRDWAVSVLEHVRYELGLVGS